MAEKLLGADDVLIPENIVNVLTDPAAYADNRIYDAYAWLRENNPLGVARQDGFMPFWVVSRHADIMEISRRNHDFHAGDIENTFMDKASGQQIRAINNGSPHLIQSLVVMDPPVHTKYRALTQKWFTPGNIRKLEDDIRQIARKAVDKMCKSDGECDFVKDVALGYPLHVIMSIFGVPEEDEPIMLRLTQELFGAQDPDYSGAEEALSAEDYADYLAKTVAGFEEYFAKLSEARRREPRDDLATVIANAVINGEPIPQREEFGYYITVATAGHDTTSSSTAVAMWELASDPEKLQKIKSNPELMSKFIEEAVRWATPIKSFMRSATKDLEYGGRKISKGDWFMLCYASANRDEDVFDDPDSFLVDREKNNQIAYGYGAHVCLGQHLARLEMRILFEELLPRIKSVSLNGTPERGKYWFINGPKHLPIRFELE